MRRLAFLVVMAPAGAVGGPAAASADTGQHAAITITSDADFTAPGSPAGCACVTAGNGTPASPYVIGPWAITAPSGGSDGWTVRVDDSGGGATRAFTISGLSAAYSGVPFTDPVIVLVDVTNPAGTVISGISANEDGRGIELDSSSYVSLDQVGFNKMTDNAVFINGSSHITLANSKLKSVAAEQVPHNADGLYAVNAAYLSIGGVTACPKSQVCNSFDYDGGFGVYLQDSHDVTIDHASASADDTGGYMLDNAWNVDLGNSSGESTGPICITLNGQKAATGYNTDLQGGLLLVNGSHDNVIHDDLFAVNSGTGIGSGGNGFVFNPCTDSDQPFSPAELPMGPNNTFTNVCYSSTDIASLEPAEPCKYPSRRLLLTVRGKAGGPGFRGSHGTAARVTESAHLAGGDRAERNRNPCRLQFEPAGCRDARADEAAPCDLLVSAGLSAVGAVAGARQMFPGLLGRVEDGAVRLPGRELPRADPWCWADSGRGVPLEGRIRLSMILGDSGRGGARAAVDHRDHVAVRAGDVNGVRPRRICITTGRFRSLGEPGPVSR